MAVKMTMLVFWVVMLCGLIGNYQCFGGTHYLQSSGLKMEAVCFSRMSYPPTNPHSITTQKTT
jgi:hypothetical protein